MKCSFKQFNAYAALSEEERTQEKFDEIFADQLDESVIGDIAQAAGAAVGKVAKAVGYKTDAEKQKEKVELLKKKRAEAKAKMDKKIADAKSFDDAAKTLGSKMDKTLSSIDKDRAAVMKKRLGVGKYADKDFARDLLAQQNEEVLEVLRTIVESGDIASLLEAKAKPVYIVTKQRDRDGRKYESKGTLEELVDNYRYTLETGQSYEREKGNKKINVNPKNIKALIDNLSKAVDNAAANGYAGVSFSYEEVTPDEELKEGWERVNTDKSSQERIKHDRAGTPVKTSDGRTGVIEYERKVPTFSQMVPFAFEIVVKFEDGTTKSFPRDEVRVVKNKKQVEESASDVLNDLRDIVMEEFDLEEDQRNTIEGLVIEKIESFLEGKTAKKLTDFSVKEWKKLFDNINDDCDEDEFCEYTDIPFYTQQIMNLVSGQGDKISKAEATEIAKQLNGAKPH